MGTAPPTRSSPDAPPSVRPRDRMHPVTEGAVDPRTATARRNAAALLDATEPLLARRVPLSMVAIAAEARLSRPTLYAHFGSIAEVVEAAVERSVTRSLDAFSAAEPEAGPPDAALGRPPSSWTPAPYTEATRR
jgi:AcrR family transcriptional regulator